MNSVWLAIAASVSRRLGRSVHFRAAGSFPHRPKCEECCGTGGVIGAHGRAQRRIERYVAVDPPDSNDDTCPWCGGEGSRGDIICVAESRSKEIQCAYEVQLALKVGEAELGSFLAKLGAHRSRKISLDRNLIYNQVFVRGSWLFSTGTRALDEISELLTMAPPGSGTVALCENTPLLIATFSRLTETCGSIVVSLGDKVPAKDRGWLSAQKEHISAEVREALSLKEAPMARPFTPDGTPRVFKSEHKSGKEHFLVILNPSSTLPIITTSFDDNDAGLVQAQDVASELCLKNPDDTFFIMRSVKAVRVPPKQVEVLEIGAAKPSYEDLEARLAEMDARLKGLEK